MSDDSRQGCLITHGSWRRWYPQAGFLTSAPPLVQLRKLIPSYRTYKLHKANVLLGMHMCSCVSVLHHGLTKRCISKAAFFTPSTCRWRTSFLSFSSTMSFVSEHKARVLPLLCLHWGSHTFCPRKPVSCNAATFRWGSKWGHFHTLIKDYITIKAAPFH